MNLLIFNGEPGKIAGKTSSEVSRWITELATQQGWTVTRFHVGEAQLPFFDFSHDTVPPAVLEMANAFRQSDVQIWLSPLYHGSVTGMMKNAIDWLEVTAQDKPPYLNGKLIGMICWADGGFALNGIHSMTQIAHSLRAWVLPFSIPVIQRSLINSGGTLNEEYKMKIKLMLVLMAEAFKKQEHTLNVTL
jgi:arsenic resistance protein ArsH